MNNGIVFGDDPFEIVWRACRNRRKEELAASMKKKPLLPSNWDEIERRCEARAFTEPFNLPFEPIGDES